MQIPRSVVMKSAGSAALVGVVLLAAFMNIEHEPEFTPAKFQGEVLVVNAKANSNAAPPAKKFDISGSVVDLHPGAQKTLTLRFDNPLNQDIRVVTANVQVVSTDRAGCPTSVVTATNFSHAAGILVGRKSSATVGIPIAMGTDVPHPCSGATFSLAYSGTAVQS